MTTKPDDLVVINETVLEEALSLVRRTFPGKSLYEVCSTMRMGERSDVSGPEPYWRNADWTVQVNNERESAGSVEEALAKLQKRFASQAQVPERAARIAAILREVPERGFDRHRVIEAARKPLEDERRLAAKGNL